MLDNGGLNKIIVKVNSPTPKKSHPDKISFQHFQLKHKSERHKVLILYPVVSLFIGF